MADLRQLQNELDWFISKVTKHNWKLIRTFVQDISQQLKGLEK